MSQATLNPVSGEPKYAQLPADPAEAAPFNDANGAIGVARTSIYKVISGSNENLPWGVNIVLGTKEEQELGTFTPYPHVSFYNQANGEKLEAAFLKCTVKVGLIGELWVVELKYENHAVVPLKKGERHVVVVTG